ncbi:MAG: serine/threonine-protein kinase [Planctomycetota bacterium]
MGCYSEAELRRFVEEILPDDEFIPIYQHLEECKRCRELEEEVRSRFELQTRLGGRFEVIKTLGRGGFGEVYLCNDTKIERKIAIKRLDTTLNPNWLSEAKNAAKFEHPNIVTIIDAIDDPPCILMEFVEGSDLSAFIRENTLTPDEAAEIAKSVANGLAAIHTKNILHRDIKSKNILRSKDGQIKLTDFGVSANSDLQSEDELPRGISYHYAAPELIKNIKANGKEQVELSHATDIYSLGVVFYELLTRDLPFEGAKDEVTQAILVGDKRTPRDRSSSIPEELEAICLKAMSVKKEDRYQEASNFAKAIEAYQQEKEDFQQKKPVERNPRRALRIGAPVLILLLGVWMMYVVNQRKTPSAQLLGLQRTVNAAFEQYAQKEFSLASDELRSKLVSAADLIEAREFASANEAYKNLAASLREANTTADIAQAKAKCERYFDLGGGEDNTFLLFPDLKADYSNISSAARSTSEEQQELLSKLQSYAEKLELAFTDRAKEAAFELGANAAICTTEHDYAKETPSRREFDAAKNSVLRPGGVFDQPKALNLDPEILARLKEKQITSEDVKMSTFRYRRVLDYFERNGVDQLKALDLPPDVIVRFKEALKPDYLSISDVREIALGEPLDKVLERWDSSVGVSLSLGWNVALGCCNENYGDRAPVIDYIYDANQLQDAGIPVPLRERLVGLLERSKDSNAFEIKPVKKEFVELLSAMALQDFRTATEIPK